jgi:hypothetical protein
MTSILKVSEIQDPTNGNTALTVDTSGRVALPNRPHSMVDFGGSAYVSKSAGIMPFDNAFVNVGNHYSTTTYKFTCPTTGLYTVEFAAITQNNSDDFEVSVRLDNVDYARFYVLNRNLNFCATVSCTAGQLLHIQNGSARAYYEGTGSNRYTYAAYTFIG